jgi:hypothetical protein
MKVLAVDVGGTHVKILVTGQKVRIPTQSGHRFRFQAGHRSDLMPAAITK